MAIVFVAVLLVLVVAQFAPELNRLRDFSWLGRWLAHTGGHGEVVGLAMTLGLPVLMCALVQIGLHGTTFGLASFTFAVVVLFYCWGPRDLDRDVEAVAKAPDSERRVAAAQALRRDGQDSALPFEAAALVEAMFVAACKRWFGVLFWFVACGPSGALLYRLAQLLAFSPELARAQPTGQQALAERIALALDWVPSHLMALALALASNFDAVFKTWRDYHAAHRQGYFCLDLGFLGAIARASVDADVAAGDGYAEDVHNPQVALDDALTLLRRVLVVWLTVIALVLLAGWLQ